LDWIGGCWSEGEGDGDLEFMLAVEEEAEGICFMGRLGLCCCLRSRARSRYSVCLVGWVERLSFAILASAFVLISGFARLSRCSCDRRSCLCTSALDLNCREQRRQQFRDRSAKDSEGDAEVGGVVEGLLVEESLEGEGGSEGFGSRPWSSAWRLDQNWRCEGADFDIIMLVGRIEGCKGADL
jgi:hypothetical protein